MTPTGFYEKWYDKPPKVRAELQKEIDDKVKIIEEVGGDWETVKEKYNT